MKWLLLGIIRLYKLAISPFLGNNCRFYPTCSDYAAQAIKEYGAMYGSWLAIKRISRCHPWHEGGDDPVPVRALNKKAAEVVNHSQTNSDENAN